MRLIMFGTMAASAVLLAACWPPQPKPTDPPPPAQTPAPYYVRIVSFAGDADVDGWANDPSAKFWSNVALGGRTVELPMTYTVATRWVDDCYDRANCANRSHEHLGSMILRGEKATIDAKYKSAVEAAFGKVKANLVRPLDPGQQADHRLDLKRGRNTLEFRVRPKTAPWAVTAELSRINANGQREVVQTIRMDQGTGPSSTASVEVQ